MRKKNRMACETNKANVPEVIMSKEQICIGTLLVITKNIIHKLSNIKIISQPKKPVVAAIRLNVDMSDWNGTPLEEMLNEKERGSLEVDSKNYV